MVFVLESFRVTYHDYAVEYASKENYYKKPNKEGLNIKLQMK